MNNNEQMYNTSLWNSLVISLLLILLHNYATNVLITLATQVLHILIIY